MQWQTAEMECGRAVTLSLHAGPPTATTPDHPLGVLILTAQQPDGSAGIKIQLLPSVRLGAPLPLRRSPQQVRHLQADASRSLAAGCVAPTMCIFCLVWFVASAALARPHMWLLTTAVLCGRRRVNCR